MDSPSNRETSRACVALVALTGAVAIVAMLLRHWDVAWTSAAAAALAGVVGARRTAPAAERARWTWWVAAATAWLLGQIAWDALPPFGSPPSPNLSDAGYWSFALLIMAGLVGPRSTSRTLRVVAVVEALPLIVAAVALTFALQWPDVTHSQLPLAGRISALAYPGLYVTAAVLIVQAMVAGALGGIRGRGVRLVLAGTIAEAVGFVVWGQQLLDGSYAAGQTLIDPLFVLGLLMIGAGGLVAAGEARRGAAEAVTGDRGGILPAAMFLTLLVAQVHAVVTDAPLGAHLALGLGLATSGATLVARGVLLGRRQRRLLGREREARLALAEREAELERLNARLADDSRHDALTGLRNRRALAEDLPQLQGWFAVALLDVDHFKAYNDRLGHLAGDNALRALATIVRGELRAGDAAYRYGGEELLIVLAGANLGVARRIAERVRTAVVTAALPHPEGLGGIVTVSLGLAAGTGEAGPLIARADAALYAAKRGGRNRVLDDSSGAALPAAPTAETSLLRQLHSVIAVSRAAAAKQGVLPVLRAVAEMVRSELRFATAVVNLRRPDDSFEAVVVLGDRDARELLLGQVVPWAAWAPMLQARHERCGAFWLPAGSHVWDAEMPVWTPSASADHGPGAWLPEDALLLPLRDPDGRILAVMAVDEPLSGRRPSDEELTVLMAVADHAALLMCLPGVRPEPGELGTITLGAAS